MELIRKQEKSDSIRVYITRRFACKGRKFFMYRGKYSIREIETECRVIPLINTKGIHKIRPSSLSTLVRKEEEPYILDEGK